MPTKKKSSAASKSRKGSTSKSGKKDVKAFVAYIHSNSKMRATIKKGWDEVIRAGKKQGYNFTKDELHHHLKKRYNVSSVREGDEPDTCICL